MIPVREPKVTVEVNGEERFVDLVEPGYLAQFDVDGNTVSVTVDYDTVE